MLNNEITPEQAGEFFLNCLKNILVNRQNNPEAFLTKEPGLYIGGMKVKKGDTIVNDNEGFPCIIRKGCCE